MYGVPVDLPINRFVGHDLMAITLARYQITLCFDGVGSVTPTTDWDLKDSAGNVTDEAQPHEKRKAYRIHEIIGISVSSYELDSPHSFSLLFKSGHRLTVYDRSKQYESCTIEFDGGPVVVI